MLHLKQSTASQSVLLGPFVDDTDGATPETGLTIANTDIRLSKNGGNMAAKNSGGGTHDENGWYTITLDATDTDTVGTLQISSKVAGALTVFMEVTVLEEEVYDDLFASGAVGYLKPVTGGRDLDVTATGAAGIDWGNIENKTTANDLSGTDIQLVDTTTTNTDMRGTDSAALATNVPDVISLANINAEVDDVITTDTSVELVAVPAATSGLRDRVAWLFALARNKITQTSTTQTLRNDADGADIATSAVSDDGTTFTRNEFS